MDQPRGRPHAILRPTAARAVFDVERVPPSEDLAHLIEYHWVVRWNTDEPHVQQIVPQPRVHMAAEKGRLLVHGITTRRFERRLTGRAHVLGTAFHPTGFRPVLGCSVSTLRGTVRPASEILGSDDRPVARAVLGTDDTVEMVGEIEDWLRELGPVPDATGVQVGQWVALAERDRSLTRVDALAERVGVSQRTLQRLFGEYVGIGPKWVLQRFRILEVAAIVHRGEDLDWAEVASELGFSDQPHLTRAFTEVVGIPPARYRLEATGRP